jgi:hypothetical protein
MLEGVGVGVGTSGTPPIPAFPISVDPSGIPARFAPPGESVDGDDEYMDEDAPPALLVAAPPQGEVALPDAAIALLAALTPVPLGIPAMPPPSKVPVALGTPDTPDVEPPDAALPATEHGMVLPVLDP